MSSTTSLKLLAVHPVPSSLPFTHQIQPSPAGTSNAKQRPYHDSISRSTSGRNPHTALASSSIHPPSSPVTGGKSPSTATPRATSKLGVLPTHTSKRQSPYGLNVTVA